MWQASIVLFIKALPFSDDLRRQVCGRGCVSLQSLVPFLQLAPLIPALSVCSFIRIPQPPVGNSCIPTFFTHTAEHIGGQPYSKCWGQAHRQVSPEKEMELSFLEHEGERSQVPTGMNSHCHGALSINFCSSCYGLLYECLLFLHVSAKTSPASGRSLDWLVSSIRSHPPHHNNQVKDGSVPIRSEGTFEWAPWEEIP